MKHFTLEELTHSDTAVRLRIDNQAPREAAERLAALVENVLDPLREIFGKSITVTSGYRSKELNRRVGGATNSQHILGEAADIVSDDNRRLFDIIRTRLPFDQLIWEKGGRWIHVSYSKERQRKQVLYT